MAQLSDEDIIVILKDPLDSHISFLREPLQAATKLNQQIQIGDNAYFKTELSQDDLRDTISTLIVKLLAHPVAKKLRSLGQRRPVDHELALLYTRIGSDDCDITPFLPLAMHVARRAPDLDIWKEVINLLSSLSRVTPPTSIPPSFGATPRTFTSASQQGSEQTRLLLNPLLREELKDCCYVKVEGFFEKYFEGKTWSQYSQRIIDSVQNDLDFPENPTEDAVWGWLSRFQEKHFSSKHFRGMYHTTGSKSELIGTPAERQLDIFVKSRDVPSLYQHEWSDIRVIGEHKASTDRAGKFLQLARYVRDVFSTQPTRLFVHGFLLLGTTMELHVFDRSGVLSAPEFDIVQKPERFVQVLAGYVLMSDEELGLDTFMERSGKRKFMTFVDDQLQEEHRLELELQPIAMQPAIVSRATSCYRTTDHKCVVKFSWQPEKRISEVGNLRAAHNVKGVAKLVGYRRITSIAELRRGLSFNKRRHFPRLNGITSSVFRMGPPPFDAVSVYDSKRSSSYAEVPSRKKLRGNSQASRLSLEHRVSDVNDPTSQNSLVAAEEEKFKDRVLNCLVISPAGRPLNRFKSVHELLRALRDAIKAHQSLYEDAKILHRDISKNNIIITDPDDAEGVSGMLIDMDMATRVDKEGNNEGTGARSMTGTLEFMAIEVLRSTIRDIHHTYRHDLESFFYVFLSVCLNSGWPGNEGPRVNPLQNWYILPLEDTLTTKRGHMLEEGFEDIILPKFPHAFECVKGLARQLRDILFHAGALYTGTPKNHTGLYAAMVGAFNATIHSLESSGLSQEIADHHLFDSRRDNDNTQLGLSIEQLAKTEADPEATESQKQLDLLKE